MTTSLIDHTDTAPPNAVARPLAPGITSRGDRAFRPDIQGLRAVAILLVILYHAGVPGFAGGFVGVDVFFVISGFLITRQLVTESLVTGRVTLSRFYARRIRRLLPSALLVIVVTVVIARIWGPALQATSVARDGLFATFYSINYWLASEGISYQNADSATSPLQHFWSLAVEEQFYIVWPVIVLLVALIIRRRAVRLRTAVLAVVIIAIGAASFSQSVTVTATDAPLAYFSLQTRGWELALGALIAIGIPHLRRMPHWLAISASWLGVAMIVYAALEFDGSTPFPGTLAAVPVLGAALVVTAGLRERPGSVEVILRSRLMQFFGAVSYGWYLWHWPAIVLGPYLFSVPFGLPERLEMSFLALWLAVLSYLLLERLSKHRRISRSRWFGIGGGLTAVAAVAVLALGLVAPPSLAAVGSSVRPLGNRLTASSLTAELQASIETHRIPRNVVPFLASAATDIPITSRDRCHLDLHATHNPPCVFGDTTATRTVVLFGDSHAEQWFGAVDAFATREHWRLVSWTKAACPVAEVMLRNPQLKRDYTECGVWRADTLGQISAMHPQLVIASQADTLAGRHYSNSTWATGTAQTLTALERAADSVVFIGDTPHPTEDVPACLARHLSTASVCDVSASSTTDTAYLAKRRASVARILAPTDVGLIDPTGWFCTAGICPAVVANTIVYRDDSHMTQHYSRALEPVLAAELAPYLDTSRASE